MQCRFGAIKRQTHPQRAAEQRDDGSIDCSGKRALGTDQSRPLPATGGSHRGKQYRL